MCIRDRAYPTIWHLGTDAQGYTYLLGYYGIYVLNQDMEHVAWMDKARWIDFDAGKVYITYGSYHYETVLYNLEELPQMADELGYTAE